MSESVDDKPEKPPKKKRRHLLTPSGHAATVGVKLPPSTKESVSVFVSTGYNDVADYRPEPEEPNFTGRYESQVDDLTQPAWILLINQASSWMEGLLVEVLYWRTHREKRSWRFSGHREAGGDFKLTMLTGKPPATGSLKVAADALLLTVDGIAHGPTPLTRFDMIQGGQRPSFFGDALEEIFAYKPLPTEEAQRKAEEEDRHLVRQAETAPLHTSQLIVLDTLLDLKVIEKLIRTALLGREPSPDDNTDSARFWRWLSRGWSPTAEDSMKTFTVRKLDEQIGKAFWVKPPDDWDHQGQLLWHRSDLPLLRSHARLMLSRHSCRGNDGSVRSLLQWIEALASHARTGFIKDELPNIKEFLGVTVATDAATEEYVYDLTFDFSSKKNKQIKDAMDKGKKVLDKAGKKIPSLPKGVLVDGGFGTLTVMYKTPDERKKWRSQFDVITGGFGYMLGIGGKGDLNLKATMITQEEWTAADFVGTFKIIDGGAFAKAKPSDLLKLNPNYRKFGEDRTLDDVAKGADEKDKTQLKAEKWVKKQIEKKVDELGKDLPMPGWGDRGSVLVLAGAGNHRPVSVPMSGGEKVRAGLGAYMFISFGVIRGTEELDHADYTRPPAQRDIDLQAQAKEQCHFKLNWSLLEREARELLRRMCARELPWLMHNETSVSVTGHCDRIASESYNNTLSRNRAENVRRALKDVLGSRLVATKIDVGGRGKQEAERAYKESGGREPLINRGRRRVDIIINGRGVLTLWGQGQ